MFKDKLKKLRENEGLSQQELADKLFVSRSAIAKWENGKGIPSDVNFEAICKYFDISKKELKLKEEDLIYTKKQKFSFLKHLLYFVILDFIVLFVTSFVLIDAYRDKKEYYEDIVFFEKAVLLKDKITEENIKILEERFDYVNPVLNFSFYLNILKVYDSGASQPIEITALSSNFIHTGVITYDTIGNKYDGFYPQEIKLLHGRIFNEESENYEIVIDQDTAILCFGKENCVNEILKTNYGDFVVVGVVSNTIERELMKKQNGNMGAERVYQTYGYISHNLSKKIIESGYKMTSLNYVEEIIITDEIYSASQIKHIVEILFNIEEDDWLSIETREKIVEQYTHKINIRTNILYTVSSVLLVFVIVGLAFLIKLFCEYRKIKVIKSSFE